MSAARSAIRPVALSKEGAEQLVIQWNDGHRGLYAWKHLRAHCPCASCREEREPKRMRKNSRRDQGLAPGPLLQDSAKRLPVALNARPLVAAAAQGEVRLM